jgi:glucosamine-6-phosphate deaminase
MSVSMQPVREFNADRLRVKVYADRAAMGAAAAAAVAADLRRLLAENAGVNMVFAAAPSQNEFLATLVASPGIAWERVTAFHLDEYIGLPKEAPQRFVRFLNERVFSRLPFKQVHVLDGDADPEAECRRYAALLAEHPLHIACIGIGENGHIAFNDPPVADFADPQAVKIVALDQRCREQQVNDGCFARIEEVPTHALTLTIPAIMRAEIIHCIVPGPTKREAVLNTVTGPVATSCPASILRTHKEAYLYIDRDAAALLPQ